MAPSSDPPDVVAVCGRGWCSLGVAISSVGPASLSLCVGRVVAPTHPAPPGLTMAPTWGGSGQAPCGWLAHLTTSVGGQSRWLWDRGCEDGGGQRFLAVSLCVGKCSSPGRGMWIQEGSSELHEARSGAVQAAGSVTSPRAAMLC